MVLGEGKGAKSPEEGHLGKFEQLIPESQGQNVALAGLYVPYSLDSSDGRGPCSRCTWCIVKSFRPEILHFEHSVDALRLRSDVINPIKTLSFAIFGRTFSSARVASQQFYLPISRSSGLLITGDRFR